MLPETVELFDIPFSRVTLDDTFQFFSERIAQREPGYVVTPNVDHVCRIHRDPAFREAYSEATLILADGMPLIWASRLLGKPLLAKISGSDLVPLLSEFAAEKGYRVFYFGAAEGVAEHAAERLKARFPELQVAGFHSPPMGFDEDPEENPKAVARVRDSKADICFVAMGAPRQEIWLRDHYKELGVPVSIGIGAGLDFVVGHQKRAPVWMQNAGMEWIWRLCHEPRRLWRRYLVEDMLFFRLLWREWRARKRPAREAQ